MSGASAQPSAKSSAEDNATYLFIQPSRDFHNSESWWSALFSILVLHLAQGGNTSKIPLCKYVGSLGEGFIDLGEYLDCSDTKFDEVLVDAKLNNELFGIDEWPNEFSGIRPDVLFHRPKLKRTTLIENKTVGANLDRQLDRYHKIKRYLDKNGWSAEFLLLISLGYETERVWKAVEESETKLILWEDVLRVMDSIEFFRSILPSPMKPYYEKLATVRL